MELVRVKNGSPAYTLYFQKIEERTGEALPFELREDFGEVPWTGGVKFGWHREVWGCFLVRRRGVTEGDGCDFLYL